MKALVIINPQAHGGRASRQAPDIRAAIERHGIDARIVETTRAGDATRIAAETDRYEFDAVVACGGDGTVFEVVNGLMQRERQNRPALSVVPVGTGNAFAREFGLRPADWERALANIPGGKPRPVDVARVRTASDEFHYLNVIGMGLAVDAGLTARRLKFIGNAAYTLGTLWRTLWLKSYPLVLDLDGVRVERDNVFAEFSNSRYTGTSFLIAPAARIDDGLLDVIMLRRLSRLRLLRLFPTVYSGRHVRFPEVETMTARKIRIESPGEMLLTVDGEFRGRTPAEIECLPGALNLWM